jgi:hypothetical protein
MHRRCHRSPFRLKQQVSAHRCRVIRRSKTVVTSHVADGSRPERVAITPLLAQWMEQQRQRVANTTAADASSSAASAGGGGGDASDDDEYSDSNQITRRSTRKPKQTNRYAPGGRAVHSKAKRKSSASTAESFDSAPAGASNRSLKRRRSVRKPLPAAAAAAAAATAAAAGDDTNTPNTAVTQLNTSAASMHELSIHSGITAHATDSTIDSQPASLQRMIILSSVLHENELLRARAAADHQRQALELEIARRDVEQARRDAEYARRDSEHARIEERASADADRLRAELVVVARTIGL